MTHDRRLRAAATREAALEALRYAAFDHEADRLKTIPARDDRSVLLVAMEDAAARFNLTTEEMQSAAEAGVERARSHHERGWV